jgi:hypothetical protein
MKKKTLNPEQLISLKKASEISGYHQDYLSYLLRKKEITGKKIGRDWFTTEESVRNYLSTKKFFPLRKLLFSKISMKKFLILIVILVLITTGVFLLPFSKLYFQKSKGDFTSSQLQSKDLNIQTSNNYKLKEIEVTTYSSDSAGGIEISVKPEGVIISDKKSKSIWDKVKEFFAETF